MARQDACTLLDEDHNQVLRLFEKYKGAHAPNEKRTLAQQIFQELDAHMRIEEEIFYPAFREAVRSGELVDEGKQEHEEARELVRKFQAAAQLDDRLMLELEDAILHHVNDEREKMFPQARKTQDLDLFALADRMEQRKAELLAHA